MVAHELFHAVQNAYDPELDRFWAEGMAQCAMKNVFPELVDFEGQLPAFFKDPTRSLDTQPSGVTAGFLYGSSVWPLFLTLRHGPSTVREVFEHETDGTKSIAAVDAVLATKGSSLAEEYPLFGAWNTATKALAGDGGYPDAAKYPGVKVAVLEDGASAITSGLAYYSYRGTLDEPSKISLETDPARNAGVAVPIDGGKPDLSRAVKLPANLEGDVLVVVAGITAKKTDAPFTLRIGAPDAEAPAGPNAEGPPLGGASGESGGCAVAAAAGLASARAGWACAALGVALAGLVAARRRRTCSV